jgi:type IV pilus assembly protein PilP
MKAKVPIAVLALLCVVLSGCGASGTSDLQQWVKDERKRVKPRVEPLPEIKTHESFVYTADTMTDPFAPFNLKPQAASNNGPRPDRNRRREPLEEYPLDSLKMVGTLSRANQSWAVIMSPDGAVHRAKVGDHMGQNFGRVIKITENKVELVELIQNPIGEWVEREASLALAE